MLGLPSLFRHPPPEETPIAVESGDDRAGNPSDPPEPVPAKAGGQTRSRRSPPRRRNRNRSPNRRRPSPEPPASAAAPPPPHRRSRQSPRSRRRRTTAAAAQTGRGRGAAAPAAGAEPSPSPSRSRRPAQRTPRRKRRIPPLSRSRSKNLEGQPEPVAFDALLKNLTQRTDERKPTTRRRPEPRMAAAAPPSSQPIRAARQPAHGQRNRSGPPADRTMLERAGRRARRQGSRRRDSRPLINPDGTVRQANCSIPGATAPIPSSAPPPTAPSGRCSTRSVRRCKRAARQIRWLANLDLIFNPKDLL